MVVKQIKTHIKTIDVDEVFEIDNISEFDKYGEIIAHYDDAGNRVDINVEYYEQDGDETPPVKSRTTKSSLLNKIISLIEIHYTRDGKLEKGIFTEYYHELNTIKPLKETTIIYNTDGVCNYEKEKTIVDKKTDEVFTITAKLPSEIEHADTKGLDNVWYFVDKNNLVTRCEVYDVKGRLIKLEDYPDNKMYVYGYYEDTDQLLSKGITSILDDKIYYIEYNKFNDKGQMEYSEITSYEEAIKTQNWLTYDDNGNCISQSEVKINLSGMLVGTTIPKPKTTITKYKYNDDNRVIESNTDDGNIVRTYEYTYFD